MNRAPSNQSGSALVFILIGIALFAALSWAIMQSSRGSAGALTQEQARLAATEIIAYGDAIAQAVQTLRLRGCTQTEISFSNNGGMSKSGNGVAFNYTNVNEPSDGSCNVFHMNGGKVIPKILSSGYVDPSLVPGTWMHAQSFYVSASRVIGHGSDSATPEGTDLLLWIGRLKPEVCRAVNSILDIPSETFVADPFAGPPFTGVYPAASEPLGNSFTAIQGKSAFCNMSSNDGINYNYHRVLIAR